MNNDSPLIPKGSLLEQKNKGRIRFKIAVFAVLGAHGVAVLALLMAGCNRNTDTTQPGTGSPGSSTLSEPSRSETGNLAASNPLPSLDSSNTAPTPENTNIGTANPPTGGAGLGSAAPAGAPAGTGIAPLPGTMTSGTGTPGAALPLTSTGASTDYKVVKHDTLAKIAKQSHVTLAALTNANPGVDSTKLKIDQVIHIPPPAAPAVTGTPTGSSGGHTTGGALVADVAAGEQIYSVKSGDSLTRIAHEFGVSVKAIRLANALKTDRIRVEQKLKIPAKTAAAPTAGGSTATAPVTGATGSTSPAPLTPGR